MSSKHDGRAVLTHEPAAAVAVCRRLYKVNSVHFHHEVLAPPPLLTDELLTEASGVGRDSFFKHVEPWQAVHIPVAWLHTHEYLSSTNWTLSRSFLKYEGIRRGG